MSILYTTKPIVLNVALAEAVGLNEAIVLQQLHYWLTDTRSGVEHDGRRWVFNTLDSWQEQFPFWSTDTIKRAFTSLRKAGLIIVEQLAKHRHDRTNYYSIRYEHDALVDECKLPSSSEAECPDLLPENTTEITSEIKPIVAADAATGGEGESETKKPATRIPYQQIADLYNRVCGEALPQCLKLNAKRRDAIRKIWNMDILGEYLFRDLDSWEGYFNDCLQSRHWTGHNDLGWKADIDFLLREKSVLKVLEAMA